MYEDRGGKIMLKKVSLMLVVCVFALLMTGCGEKNVEGTLEEIMTKVYAGVKDEDKPMMLDNMEVNDENIEGFLGTADIEYETALASESMTGSIAHSVVLVRTKEGADVDAIKTKIKENINPRKWICVGVEEKDVVVESKGNLIMVLLIENETTRNTIKDAFNNL